MGLRAEKKERTRRDLVRAALRLFDEQGFETTPVREIAAACEVSPATVYLYFPTKEDLIFPDRGVHDDLFSAALADRRADDSPAEVLAAGVRRLLTPGAWSIDPEDPLAAARARVIMASPTLQARALIEVTELHRRWTEQLRAAFPELDGVTAAARTGAVLGAVVAALTDHLRHATTSTDLVAVAEQALDAVGGATPRPGAEVGGLRPDPQSSR